MKKIVLIGAGTFMHSVVDSINPEAFEIVGIMDNRLPKHIKFFNLDVIGRIDELDKIKALGVDHCFITLGDLEFRKSILVDIQKNDLEMVSVIDRSAILAKNVKIGAGTFIGKGAIVNAMCDIGRACIINSGSIIEHHCIIGENVHIASGATLSSSVQVNSNTLIGANASIIAGKIIGNDVKISPNVIITSDLGDDKRVLNTAKKEIF